mgnify:CR=1 FL=1
MLQQVMTNPGEITFREVPVPEVKDDQVLVKIRNIGICGSDIHVYHGKHPFTKYPVTQGHEVSGEIAEIGKNVSGFQIGQKVTIEPQVYCGHCYPCRHGKYNLCEELKVMGFQTTGTASEYFAVDASKVTPIPEDMSYEEGAMIEPLAVAVHGVKQMGDVKGMNITVIGAGPIGNLVAQTAKGMGAAKVMITDVSWRSLRWLPLPSENFHQTSACYRFLSRLSAEYHNRSQNTEPDRKETPATLVWKQRFLQSR